MPVRIGTAGWSIPKEQRTRFGSDGSALERYSRVLNCVEINSTFYRSHRAATYERWAASVPAEFAFSLKMPKEITHERRLVNCQARLNDFILETAALGRKRRVILVQLPPKLSFQPSLAEAFFAALHSLYGGQVALEPRHPSWFAPEVGTWLSELGIARVAADPPVVPEAALPGGSLGLTYLRLHGSPRIYYSPYSHEAIAEVAARALASPEPWCVFDNTASGAALTNALQLVAALSAPEIKTQN